MKKCVPNLNSLNLFPYLLIGIMALVNSVMVVSRASAADANNGGFLVFSQVRQNKHYLKSLHDNGEVYTLSPWDENGSIQVIPPFIYYKNYSNNTLTIFNSVGRVMAQNIDCESYSATSSGVLVLNSEHVLKIYSILSNELVQTKENISDVKKFKISENVILIQRINSSFLETYKLSSNLPTFFSIQTHGWNEKSNIKSAALNKNFFVSKDNLTIVNVVNFQGNSIYQGRGNLKYLYLTGNHFIAHYGNGRAEVYNPHSGQFILTLPQVYTIKQSQTFTSFKWDNQITVLNEKGEIFPLPLSDQIQYSQGETAYALTKNNVVTIYNSSGKIMNERTMNDFSESNFYGDFICTEKEEQSEKRCFLVNDRESPIVSVTLDPDMDHRGLNNWGMYVHSTSSQMLNVFLNNGYNNTFGGVKKVFDATLPRNNDYNFIDF